MLSRFSCSNLTFLADRAIIAVILKWIGLQMLSGHRIGVTQNDRITLAGEIGKDRLVMAASGRDSFFAFAYYYFYFTGGALRVREVS